MHRLSKTPITLECFSFENVVEEYWCEGCNGQVPMVDMRNIRKLSRLEYLRTGNKDTWKALIQLLPSGWNQMRTWTANYSRSPQHLFFAQKP